MDAFKNKNFRTMPLKEVTKMFQEAGINFSDGILKSVYKKILQHINEQSVLEMDKDSLFIKVKGKTEETDILKQLRAFYRFIDLSQQPEIDIAKTKLEALSSYQVSQLFLQKVKTNKIAQALAWDNLIEDNSICGEVLAAEKHSDAALQVLEKMGLNPGQKCKFDNMIKNFKEPKGTGVKSISTKISGVTAAAVNSGLGGNIKIESVSFSSTQPPQKPPKNVASDEKNTPKQTEERKESKPQSNEPEDDGSDLK